MKLLDSTKVSTTSTCPRTICRLNRFVPTFTDRRSKKSSGIRRPGMTSIHRNQAPKGDLRFREDTQLALEPVDRKIDIMGERDGSIDSAELTVCLANNSLSRSSDAPSQIREEGEN
jgi:hypothetical protein